MSMHTYPALAVHTLWDDNETNFYNTNEIQPQFLDNLLPINLQYNP